MLEERQNVDSFYHQFLKNESLQSQKKLRHDAAEKCRAKGIPFLRITQIAFRRIILHIDGIAENLNTTKHYGVRFVTHKRDKMFYPDTFVLNADNTFHLTLNIMCSTGEEPLSSGDYELVLFEEYHGHRDEMNLPPAPETPVPNMPFTSNVRYGHSLYRITIDAEGFVQSKKRITHEYPAFLDESVNHLCDAAEDNPYNFIVTRSKNTWFHLVANENMDTLAFQYHIDYKPLENYGVLFINRKLRKKRRRESRKAFKYNIWKYFLDLKMWTIQKLHTFFGHFAKHEGNVILFCSASRAEIGGNEKFIYDRMIERGLDKRFRFLFDFKARITTERSFWQMIRFDWYLAIADVIVLDDYYPLIYDLKYDSRTKLVQVWHACGAFKTVGFERIGKADGPHFNSRTHKNYTHVIVSSEISAQHNAEAFCISRDKFYITGIPRTDIFFDPQYREATTARMLEEFPAARGKHVYLYAPTFRGTNANDAYFPFGEIDLDRWGRHLVEEDAILIVKMHPFVHQHIDIPRAYQDRIFDASSYREVCDILFIADVLITDYSSVIYEMSLLRRPMIFYAFDQKSYEYERDFYEPYEETVPGKIVHDFDDLLECLRNQNYDFDKMDAFIAKNFAHLDGKSTDRVIDQIFLEDTPKETT